MREIARIYRCKTVRRLNQCNHRRDARLAQLRSCLLYQIFDQALQPLRQSIICDQPPVQAALSQLVPVSTQLRVRPGICPVVIPVPAKDGHRSIKSMVNRKSVSDPGWCHQNDRKGKMDVREAAVMHVASEGEIAMLVDDHIDPTTDWQPIWGRDISVVVNDLH